MGNNQLLEQLKKAIAGLVWMSEADYPWQIVSLPADIDHLNCQILLQYYHYPADSKIKTTNLDSFFAPATAEYEWYGEKERSEAQRYRGLYQLLQDNLENIQVYLVGETEIDVYLVGQTSNKRIVGLSTQMVET